MYKMMSFKGRPASSKPLPPEIDSESADLVTGSVIQRMSEQWFSQWPVQGCERGHSG